VLRFLRTGHPAAVLLGHVASSWGRLRTFNKQP